MIGSFVTDEIPGNIKFLVYIVLVVGQMKAILLYKYSYVNMSLLIVENGWALHGVKSDPP